jgi:hypothetical protein
MRLSLGRLWYPGAVMLGRILQAVVGLAAVTTIVSYAATVTVHPVTLGRASPGGDRDPMVRAIALCDSIQNTKEYRMAPLGGAYRRDTDAMCEEEKAQAARAVGIAPRN